MPEEKNETRARLEFALFFNLEDFRRNFKKKFTFKNSLYHEYYYI